MEFRCWMGLTIEGKSYIIAEKILYKEKTSDDVWTEYGLVTKESNDRTWLTVADGGLSCSLSSPAGKMVPNGFRLHDKGTEVVTGVWGDTDAAVGDEAQYEQYESATGTHTFFVEIRNGQRSASMGKKLTASDLVSRAPSLAERHLWAARVRNHRILHGIRFIMLASLIYGGVTCALSILLGDDVLGTREWHAFRNFIGMPYTYTLYERLVDAPYYREEDAEDGTRIYTAQIDAGTTALDLIEGVNGNVQDAFTETSEAEQPLVLRTQTETVRITNAADGTTRISLTAAAPDTAFAADELKRSYVLIRYAELVRTGDARGHAGVTREEK